MRSIFNFQFSIFNLKTRQKGFTLVELLASIIVLVAIGTVIAGIISSSLRGANKTNNIENIRQNGNYALNQISKNIQYAQTLNGFKNEGETYVTSCPFSTPTPPAMPEPVKQEYNYLQVIPFNSVPIEYKCLTSTNPPTFTANGEEIIDTNSVDLQNCSITCTQTNATDVPIVGISFTLGVKDSSNLVEKSSPPITFETSITLRNYKK